MAVDKIIEPAGRKAYFVKGGWFRIGNRKKKEKKTNIYLLLKKHDIALLAETDIELSQSAKPAIGMSLCDQGHTLALGVFLFDER